MSKLDVVSLLVADTWGVYLPQDFVERFTLSDWGIDPESWAANTCAAGPDEEGYWDAWDEILNKAEYKEDGHIWRLHQDGDLWALCYDLMTDEEKSNFGFEE